MGDNFINTLSNFTDIFTDESQPISLSPEVESQSRISIPSVNNTCQYTRPAKHTGQHGDFRSVEEIDEKYRCAFSYPYFNLVQSKIIEDALYSDKSMVVCAPTGSGKTVAFEMAIVQLLMKLEDMNYKDDFKIIYMAPVKAVCTERLTEWYPKFNKLGLLCIEVTGDTCVDFSKLKPYKVIITTPEKWDVLTRRWTDFRGLVGVIKLFLIDEVHILNDESRGPVLEAVVSRMKTIESSCQSEFRIEQLKRQYLGSTSVSSDPPPRIRFVAVSATVSNPEDVAEWLGSDMPAVYHKYGDECRPVKLKRIVEGYPCAEGTSIFKFDIILSYKLWPIIQKYYDGKPTLIFCNTRKSVALTAETLSRELTISFNVEQRAKLAELASKIKNKKLQALVLNGVGCHHAGLLYEERINIELAFRQRDLPILITTTTLAMGVNLPAHLVIIKNTQQYVNGAYQEYSISTVLQMVGRAGRPQFDHSATAVIMTRTQDKARYQSLVCGSEPLQSYLHKRLTENLNSEAALHTVNDVAQCVQWLRSTFLYVRAARDPKRYLGLPSNAPTHLIMKKIEELCVKAMNGLASSGLITMDEASCIESTEAGRLMSIYYLDFETMKHIMKIDGTESLEQLLWVVCESHELSEMHLRVDERRCLNTLNRNKAAATIRFPMKGKISTRQMKVNCVIQAILGCLPIPDPSLNQEAMKIMRIADRICKCMVSYITRPNLVTQKPKYFSAILNSLVLAKCMTAHLWDNSPYVSKQLKGIGPTFSNLLATAGKVNFMLLEETHPRDLERIMNKGPPAGNVLRKQISLLPKYQLTVTPLDENCVSVQLHLTNQCHLAENMDQLTAGEYHKSYLIVGDSENHILLLASFNDKDLITIYDGTITHTVIRKHRFEHKVFIHCVSCSYVGIDVQCEYLYKDLDPKLIPTNDNIRDKSCVIDTPRKNSIKKQTNITDTFKERKRKNNEIDITQSKEKKKRDNALIEKFKLLKKSFSVTSKELQDNLKKADQISNTFIDTPVTSKEFEDNFKKPDYIANISNSISEDMQAFEHDENFDGELLSDFSNVPIKTQPCKTIDNLSNNEIHENISLAYDGNFDSILNEIENEISKNDVNVKHQSDIIYSDTNEKIHFSEGEQIMDDDCDFSTISTEVDDDFKQHCREPNKNLGKKNKQIDQTEFKKYFSSKNFKPHNKGTKKADNFSFIELLEKNIVFSDEENNSKQVKDNGFSETIKEHLQKFLHEAKDTVPKSIENNKIMEYCQNPNIFYNNTLKNECRNRDQMQKQVNIIEDNIFCKTNSTDNHFNIEGSHNISTHTNIPHNFVGNKNSDLELVHAVLQSPSTSNFETVDSDNSDPNSSTAVHKIFRNLSTNDNFDVNDIISVNSNFVKATKSIPKGVEENTLRYSNENNIEKNNSDSNVLVLFESRHEGHNSNNLLQNKIDTDKNTKSVGDYKSMCNVPVPLSFDNNRTDLTPFENDKHDLKTNIKLYQPLENNPVSITVNECFNENRNVIMKSMNEQNALSNVSDPERIASYLQPSCSYINKNGNCVNIEKDSSTGHTGNFQVTREQYSFTSTEIDVWTKRDISHECRFRVIKKMKVDVDISKVEVQLQNSENDGEHRIDEYMNRSDTNKYEDYNCSAHEEYMTKNTIDSRYNNLAKKQDADILYHSKIIKRNEIKEPNLPTALEENIVAKNTNTQPTKTDEDSSDIGKTAVDNILKKYISNLKVKDEMIQPFRKDKKYEKNTQRLKQRRPFKIMDIHRVDINLPKDIIETVPISITESSNDCNETYINKENDITEISSGLETQFDKSSIIEDLTIIKRPEIIPTLMESSASENSYNIDQSMLNPKKLLQCYNMINEEDAEIIPPPPQFCDEPQEYGRFNTTSPIDFLSYDDDDDDSFACRDNLMNDPESFHSKIKDNNVALTCSKNIETWSLSPEDKIKSVQGKNTFTITRKTHCATRTMHFDRVDGTGRQKKLGEFKFHTKDKFKVRR